MNARDQLREIIRSEVARANPIEEARRALELIVETSVRHTEAHGEVTIAVVGDDGRLRAVDKVGPDLERLIRSLVERLRSEHPSLFQPPQDRAARTSGPPHLRIIAANGGPEPSGRQARPSRSAAGRSSRRAPVERDWLEVGAQARPPTGHAPRRATQRPRQHEAEISSALARQRSGEEPRVHLLDTRSMLRDAVQRCLGSARAGLAAALARAKTVAAIGLFVLAATALVFGIRGPSPGRDRPVAPVLARSAAEPESTGALQRVRPRDTVPRPTAAPTPASGPTAALPSTSGPKAAPSPASEGVLLTGVPDVLDTATLRLSGAVIRLFGVEWARGAGQPEDFLRYLRGREVSCRLVSPMDTYRCQVEGRDLSLVVLFNGGGRATAEATEDLKLAEAHAKSARIGVWSK